MNLVALARKWIGRKVTDDTPEAELAERADFNARAAKVWLDYHGNEDWAKRKLASGLNLTPEALEYMERELAVRAAQQARVDAIIKEMEDEKPATGNALAKPADVSEPDGDGGSDSENPGDGVQKGS